MNEKEKKVVLVIRRILLVLIIFWMIAVFMFSHQTGEGSSGLSSKVSLMLFKNEEIAKQMEPFIRKLAHGTEYAIGGMLVYGFFLTDIKMNSKKQKLFSELFIIFYAVTDEFHQLFVNGRNGSIIDIIIDSIGGAAGIFIIIITWKIIMGLEYKAKEDVKRMGKM